MSSASDLSGAAKQGTTHQLQQVHTLFLKLNTYFLKPNENVSISLINGTFDKSENIITRNRMTDVSIVLPDNKKIHPDTSQWRDINNETVLDFKTAGPGTYVLVFLLLLKLFILLQKISRNILNTTVY